ncbi:MAG: hypothetical protein MZV64_34100 [Ignavibacteriales bacterium]|nr:hypothetical protein [Ignavibacteriales bacterium]
MVGVYAELLELRPDDADLAREARALRHRARACPSRRSGRRPRSFRKRTARRSSEAMAQADLYMQQGLVRIARRLLENLRFRYPEDPQILRKIAVLDEVRTHMDEDEIRAARREDHRPRGPVQGTRGREETEEKKRPEGGDATARGRKTEPRPRPSGKRAADGQAGRRPGRPRRSSRRPARSRPRSSRARRSARPTSSPRRTSSPSSAPRPGSGSITTFARRPAEELRLARRGPRPASSEGTSSRSNGSSRRSSPSSARTSRPGAAVADAETHYQLGLAFMGQGLTGEAVEELTQAAKDETLALDSYSAHQPVLPAEAGFRRGGEMAEDGHGRGQGRAPNSITRSSTSSRRSPRPSDDRDRALSLFREIRDWNPGLPERRRPGLEKAARLNRALSEPRGSIPVPSRMWSP